ncbi:hypothetical protein [Bacillus paranthracis]|uniref:hypothetical protein n=1 Tax=Bacillus paranthracis TaxID=2026186 RepID=UPI002D7890E6|nr:hypothetical protein [Bacillus paranthracis]
MIFFNNKKKKKKKLRKLDLNDETWVKIGEIYSRVLVNKEVSLKNEDIIAMAVGSLHDKIVKKGILDR